MICMQLQIITDQWDVVIKRHKHIIALKNNGMNKMIHVFLSQVKERLILMQLIVYFIKKDIVRMRMIWN